ncbi:uncharacterized protein LOC144862623 [Branchiostoma floridae x Branchiostoma japonicum]
MQIKHAAESEEDYQRTCEDIAAVLDRCSPGLGNLILDEVRHRDCVLVKYLLYTGTELLWNRPMDIIETMSNDECKEELRHLGVIYIKVENATLFTGELHMDPRTWDPVEVTQWVARTLLPRDPTATITDLQMTGAQRSAPGQRRGSRISFQQDREGFCTAISSKGGTTQHISGDLVTGKKSMSEWWREHQQHSWSQPT